MIVAVLCERRFFKTAAVIDRRYRVNEFLWTQKSLSDAVTIIEKERDRDFYAILTTAQKEKWSDLVGKPVHIQWPLELWNE